MLTLDRARPVVAACLATTALLASGLAVSTGAAATTRSASHHHAKLPKPLATPHEGPAIEGFAPDQSQFFCRSTVEPGVKAFERRVLKQYPVSHSDGDMRGCNVGGTSEHKDGRAWDWGVDHRIPGQRAAGKSMLKWLFATDSHGNQDAMFRRLGLMYIIWNKQIWGAWDQQWEPYSCSGPTLCHVNHMHFSFGWAGAEKKTSYWTRKVAPVIEPPLPVFAKQHGHRSLRVSASAPEKTAHWLLAKNATYRITASGVLHGSGKSRSDALCTKTGHGWVRSSGLSIGGDQVQGWGAQWRPVHDNESGCNTSSHTYRMVLHQSTKSTVSATWSQSGSKMSGGSIRARFVRTG